MGPVPLPLSLDCRHPRTAELAERVRWIQWGYRGRGPLRPSGWAALDSLLGGGWACGGVHELVSSSPAGPLWTVAWQASGAAAAVVRRPILCIDERDEIYPPGVVQLGVPLDWLLVVRVRQRLDALWVCEQALRSRALATVIAPLRSIDPHTSRRLQLAAELGGGLGFLILDQPRGSPTFAVTRLQIDPLPPARPGEQRIRATVLKRRESRAGESIELRLPSSGDCGVNVSPASRGVPGPIPPAARSAG